MGSILAVACCSHIARRSQQNKDGEPCTKGLAPRLTGQLANRPTGQSQTRVSNREALPIRLQRIFAANFFAKDPMMTLV